MLTESKVENLISEIASDSDLFGGGAVGGIIAAMAIGLILMSIKISIKRKSFQAQSTKVKDEVNKYIKTLEISLVGSKATADADATAFQEYMKAVRSKNSDIEPYAINCFNVPKQLADISIAALSTSKEVESFVSGSIKADMIMGQDLLKTILKSCLINMQINLKQIKRETKHKEFSNLINEALKFEVKI